MTIEITPRPPPVRLDVQLKPIYLGELQIKQFFILTWRMGIEGDGDWEIHCIVENPTDHTAAGTIRCTGELNRAGGAYVHQIDVTQNITVGPKGTHRFILESRHFPVCWYMDLCWAKIDTSWGENTERQLFYAGFLYDGPWDAELVCLGVGTNYAKLRFGSPYCAGTESDPFRWYLKTPWYGDAEQTLSAKLYSLTHNCSLGCYYYAYPLLSKREYYSECRVAHVHDIAIFTTK